MTTHQMALGGFQLDELGPPSYDQRLVPRFLAPLADTLLESTAPRPGERVLDLACGTGVVARRAAPPVGTGPPGDRDRHQLVDDRLRALPRQRCREAGGRVAGRGCREPATARRLGRCLVTARRAAGRGSRAGNHSVEPGVRAPGQS